MPNYRPGGNRWYYGAGYYGGYAPIFGLGWGAGYRAGTRYGYTQPVVTPQYADDEPEDEEPIRVTAGVDAMVFVQTQSGFTLGINGGFEIDRWGFNVAAQNISVASDDGALTVDQLQQLNLHLTFAAITGSYGRLKLEAGADTFWAQDLTVLAPTIGLSGFVLIAGPLAIEGSVMVTPFPVRQLDVRAGLAVGLGPFGIRAGWRTQILDDQGLVDGVVHQDTFMGPYLGVGLAI